MIDAALSVHDYARLSHTSTASYQKFDETMTSIRLTAIKEEAQSIGMQGGLAEQSVEINTILGSNEGKLDRVFNFNLLLYKNNVLPPVLESMEHSLEMSPSGEALRIGGQTYRIIQQVRFVSTPPTWRDYLWMNYPYPELPNKILLPQTAEEAKVWESEVYAAWGHGRDQAVEIFKINVNRLSRDLRGMLSFRGGKTRPGYYRRHGPSGD
jgi:defect in organelle trafficking protein DotC